MEEEQREKEGGLLDWITTYICPEDRPAPAPAPAPAPVPVPAPALPGLHCTAKEGKKEEGHYAFSLTLPHAPPPPPSWTGERSKALPFMLVSLSLSLSRVARSAK